MTESVCCCLLLLIFLPSSRENIKMTSCENFIAICKRKDIVTRHHYPTSNNVYIHTIYYYKKETTSFIYWYISIEKPVACILGGFQFCLLDYSKSGRWRPIIIVVVWVICGEVIRIGIVKRWAIKECYLHFSSQIWFWNGYYYIFGSLGWFENGLPWKILTTTVTAPNTIPNVFIYHQNIHLHPTFSSFSKLATPHP